AQGDAQSWISDLARQTDACSSFNELLDTPIDFSNFIMHRLNVDTLTPDLLDGPTYELMRGSCTSLTELEYHLEEVYKATTDQLDWVNPEEEETAKADEELKETGTGGDDVRESEGESEEEKETSEEEEVSFNPIPRTPEDSEKESDDEEEQESR
nr:hypothetical protein [Tanacetum cinerariifolium]